MSQKQVHSPSENHKNMITPKEKAKELINVFKKHVSGYVGSSLLVNLELPEQILYKAKECALVAVNEILSHDFLEPQIKRQRGIVPPKANQLEYWFDVKKEIQNYEDDNNTNSET